MPQLSKPCILGNFIFGFRYQIEVELLLIHFQHIEYKEYPLHYPQKYVKCALAVLHKCFTHFSWLCQV